MYLQLSKLDYQLKKKTQRLFYKGPANLGTSSWGNPPNCPAEGPEQAPLLASCKGGGRGLAASQPWHQPRSGLNDMVGRPPLRSPPDGAGWLAETWATPGGPAKNIIPTYSLEIHGWDVNWLELLVNPFFQPTEILALYFRRICRADVFGNWSCWGFWCGPCMSQPLPGCGTGMTSCRLFILSNFLGHLGPQALVEWSWHFRLWQSIYFNSHGLSSLYCKVLEFDHRTNLWSNGSILEIGNSVDMKENTWLRSLLMHMYFEYVDVCCWIAGQDHHICWRVSGNRHGSSTRSFHHRRNNCTSSATSNRVRSATTLWHGLRGQSWPGSGSKSEIIVAEPPRPSKRTVIFFLIQAVNDFPSCVCQMV